MSNRKPSIGQGAKKIDSAMEHLSFAWGALVRDGIAHHVPSKGMPAESLGWPPTTSDAAGSPGYHMAAAIQYLSEARGIFAQHVSTEGQLCPYQDCAWDCGLREAGWYRCPHCGREFWCRETDSDIEDYACYRAGEHDRDAPAKPETIPVADDLGPSWGTPDEDTSR